MTKYYILLIEHLGDIIACEPIARYIKTNFKDSEITWIVNKKYKDVLIANPYIDNIIEVNSLSEADTICESVREKGYKIIDAHYDGRVCTQTSKKHKNYHKSNITMENIFENNFSILNSFSLIAGLPKLDDAPIFYLDENIKIQKNIPQNYIVFHCKSNTPEKDWDKKKWNKLASILINKKYNIIEIGKEPVINNNSEYYHDCTDINNIQEIASIIKNADCFIGIDSAFAHIANCFNKYSILIFGKYFSFKNYNPYSGNYKNYKNCTFIRTNSCSEHIPVYLVQKAFNAFMKNDKRNMNKVISYYYFDFIKTIKNFLKNLISISNVYVGSKKFKQIILFGIKLKFSTNTPNNQEYIDYVLNKQLDKSKFVEINDTDISLTNNNTKLISFYLPQFHSFPANDKWFGRGFSEWTNATKALPQYIGHNQPHLPIDVGFYNLETTAIIKRQIELAQKYGIYGYSFYYYWYSGKKIMERPIQAFLNDKSLNFPFFLFWANENWTHLWGNGADEEILYKQELLEDDAVKFMNDILPYMKDSRYIKINNKPLLIIYNPEIYPEEIFNNFIKEIRQIAQNNDFADLYIMTIRKPFMGDGKFKTYLEKNQLDAIVEFFPGCVHNLFKTINKKIVNPLFKGNCFDMDEFVDSKRYLHETDGKLFKGLFPNWDNTARRCYKGSSIFEMTPELYKTWLKDIMKWTKLHNSKEEQFVFINAWNEWAEGAHLEPDQTYGYAYLQATREALEEENE